METAKQLPAIVVKTLLEGRFVAFGEYRGGQAVEFNGKGGKVYRKSQCVVETGPGESVTVVEFLPDGVKLEDWRQEHKKGDMVLVVARTLDTSSGVQVVTGKLLKAL